MRFSVACRVGLSLTLVAAALTACSRDPNVASKNTFRAASATFEKGKYREAAIEFINALKIDQNYADAHYQLAQSYLEAQSGRTCLSGVRPDGRTAARELSSPHRHGQAADCRRQFPVGAGTNGLAAGKTPGRSQSPFVAANLLAAKADFPAAIVEMQKAIALDPGDWNLYLNLALMLMKNNQSAAAEAEFQEGGGTGPKA